MRDEQDPLDQFWEGDYLDRREDATYLGEYLGRRFAGRRQEAGFVLAVNAEWGVGKTFMLTRWCDQLRFQKHPVVYFDAWANDFTPEPLIAFIAELNEGLKEQFKSMPAAKKKLLEWIEQGKKAVVPTLKAASGIAIKQATGMSVGALFHETDEDDSGSQPDQKIDAAKIAEQLSKAVGAALKEHVTTRKAINACRKKLEALLDCLEKSPIVQLPIYVIVDELDRCRPDYAIQLLEGIKHLFGVRGVYFVIGTNISQLAHSVGVVYGQKFDSESYLKRFFDLEYNLPNPNGERFAKELLVGLTWCPEPKQLATGLLPQFGLQRDEADYLPFLFATYADWFNLSLRDQHGALRILDAALGGLKEERIHIHFLLFLVMLFQRDPQIYGHVITYRNLGDDSKFTEFKKRMTTADNLKVSQPGDNGVWNKEARVPLQSIALLYLRYTQNHQGPNSIQEYLFPANLLEILDYDTRQKKVNVERYFSLVRHAGRFSHKS